MRWLLAVWLLALACPAQAFEWADLWQSAEQRAQASFDAGDYASAVAGFSDPSRRAAALSGDERHAEAAQAFAEAAEQAGAEAARARYNQGTALARAGDLSAALGALQQAIDLDPEHADARDNLKWVREQMQSQEKPSESPQQGEQGDESSEEADPQQAQNQPGEAGKPGEQPPADEQPGESESADSSPAQNESTESDEQVEQLGQQLADNKDADADADADNGEAGAQPGGSVPQPADQPLSESDQATEAWLRQIPDDPAGLLRRKLQLIHQREYARVTDDPQPW